MKKKIYIYVDCRSLQDLNYQTRGIGVLCYSLLKEGKKLYGDQISFTGLIDENLLALPEKHRALFDEWYYHTNVVFNGPSMFFELSPMTHDPSWIGRFLSHEKVFSFTIVYDFIPFERPGYLPTNQHAIEYITALKWLNFYDYYFPISYFTLKRLKEICNISEDKITQTKCPVRFSLENYANQLTTSKKKLAPIKNNKENYFITVAGESRKNVKVIIKALRLLNDTHQTNYHLKIIGPYQLNQLIHYLDLYGTSEPSFIKCISGVNDKELATLYHHALASVSASYIEGFSLPITEAILCGTPSIVSNIDAHNELITQPEALFDPDDANKLMTIMWRLVSEPAFREGLLNQQRKFLELYNEKNVAKKFWSRVIDKYKEKFSLSKNPLAISAKPKVAFLTPFPPDESGVADYSYAMAKACMPYFNTTIFTNTLKGAANTDLPKVESNITLSPLITQEYDAVISVVGNSHFHTSILENMEKFGGPCILHDSRLTGIYFARLGREKFEQAASYFLQRELGPGETSAWMEDRQHPSLFLEYIIKKAQPLIVHSRQIKKLIAHHYNKEAVYIPFGTRIKIDDTQLTEEHCLKTKKSLGLEGRFIISSFGAPSSTKFSMDCLMILHQLHGWNIPAFYCVVGKIDPNEPLLIKMAKDLDINKHVRLFYDHVSEENYFNYLIATDCAIQLRSYDLGQPSGALTDCIAAGLTSVATDTLAEACDAPSYITRMAGKMSPLLIAEKIAAIYEAKNFHKRISAERTNYCSIHSFENYAQKLNKAIFI